MTTDRQWATIGSLLIRTADPHVAAAALSAYLTSPSSETRQALDREGVAPRLVDDFRTVLPTDHFELARACELGAAWAEGRQSVTISSSWSPVVSGRELDPATFERLTAETMIGLIMGARREIRLFSAFVDAGGVSALAYALASATRRGVTVTFGYRRASDRTQAANVLRAQLEEHGAGDRARIVPMSDEDAFPHLKLLAVDGERAYIGSANVTFPALTYNLEVGAVVEGSAVSVYEELFDALTAAHTHEAIEVADARGGTP
jgi:phosphatidylserine/phosphatidylglycerophosphate/cardiolipin synthase-like enzyme